MKKIQFSHQLLFASMASLSLIACTATPDVNQSSLNKGVTGSGSEAGTKTSESVKNSSGASDGSISVPAKTDATLSSPNTAQSPGASASPKSEATQSEPVLIEKSYVNKYKINFRVGMKWAYDNKRSIEITAIDGDNITQKVSFKNADGIESTLASSSFMRSKLEDFFWPPASGANDPHSEVIIESDTLYYLGTETLTVPTGTYTCDKLLRKVKQSALGSKFDVDHTFWMAQGVGLVKSTSKMSGFVSRYDEQTLSSFTP